MIILDEMKININMSSLYKKLSFIFYAGLIVFLVLLLLPVKYKLGVYTPNLLGWLLLFVVVPIVLITYFWLCSIEWRTNNLKKLFIRTIVFVFTILISCLYWYGKSQQMI